MNNISPQSKSFIILAVVALVGTYLCIMLWSDLAVTTFTPPYRPIYYNSSQKQNWPQKMGQSQAATVPPVDTSAWKTYTNKKFNFSFQYDPTWKVLAAKTTKDGYNMIQLDPGSKYYNIKIYVSPTDYYIMDGLPATQETVSGQTAYNVNNALYGIKNNGQYYTFDVGLSMSLVPEFDALVHSVKFQ